MLQTSRLGVFFSVMGLGPVLPQVGKKRPPYLPCKASCRTPWVPLVPKHAVEPVRALKWHIGHND